MARSDAINQLRVRVRRGQFVVGLGFGSLILGSLLTVALLQRLAPRLLGAPAFVLFPIELVLRNLWCLAVLPLVVWAASRAVPLKPWSTAIGALVTGEVFLRMLLFIQGGLGAMWVSGLDFARWLLVAALSAVLVRTAVIRGRTAAEATQAQARALAETKAGEYAAFAREAERLGERTAQAERERAAHASAAPEGDGTAESERA